VSAGSAYSFSRVSTFEQCPRRYRYRYVDGVREAFRGVEAFVGQQIHSTIEWLFSQRLCSADPSLEQAVRYYCDVWDRDAVAEGPPIRVVRGDQSIEFYRRGGADLVARFWRERFVPDRLETLAVEMEFSVRLARAHAFRGFIDRVARDDAGTIHLIDYKTGRRAPSRFAGKEADQLRSYAVAWFLDHPTDRLELVLDFVQPGALLRERISRAEAIEFERALAARISELGQATVFPTKPGVLCQWCGFNDLCEAYAEQTIGRSGRSAALPLPRY
jgi:putative RecB family exonuclease